jgi:MFS family permease
MLTDLSRSTSSAFLLVSYGIFGLGSGLVNPPITNTAVSGMPPAQAGVAAAIASTSRQVGMTLGVAVVGAVAGTVGAAAAGAGGGGFAEATHPAWWIIAVMGAVVAVLGFVTTTPWAHRTAVETAERLQHEDEPLAVAA